MKTFEKYTATERKELTIAITMMEMMGVPAPTTTEEMEKWCDTYLANKRAEEEKKRLEEEKKKNEERTARKKHK